MGKRIVHRFWVGQEVRVIQDLSEQSPGIIGRTGLIKELLAPAGGYPQYKVLVFGGKGFVGGLFEVDEREIEKEV